MGGFNGFLGTRASFMIDFVVAAMIVILPMLAWSISRVRSGRHYALHKRVQLALGIVLLVTVAVFEADIRIHGWRDRAASSAFAGGQGATDWISVVLAIHLTFAVSTALLWILVIARALRGFSTPPQPGAHSAWHRRFGWIAAIDLACTAVTGWIFYWMAFVA
jgi:putative membrane protein